MANTKLVEPDIMLARSFHPFAQPHEIHQIREFRKAVKDEQQPPFSKLKKPAGVGQIGRQLCRSNNDVRRRF